MGCFQFALKNTEKLKIVMTTTHLIISGHNKRVISQIANETTVTKFPLNKINILKKKNYNKQTQQK